MQSFPMFTHTDIDMHLNGKVGKIATRRPGRPCRPRGIGLRTELWMCSYFWIFPVRNAWKLPSKDVYLYLNIYRTFREEFPRQSKETTIRHDIWLAAIFTSQWNHTAHTGLGSHKMAVWFAVCGHSIGNKSNSSIEETRNIALLVHYGVILCHEWWKSGKTHVGGSVAEWSKALG